MTSRKHPRVSLLKACRDFFGGDFGKGSLLILATLGAIFMVNGPFSESYQHILEQQLTIKVPPLDTSLAVRDWINAMLMSIFFFSVGLEIKREITSGSLHSIQKAMLPVAGALGGMIVPALIFVIFNWEKPGIVGWAIPMATDPAFVIAILAVLRKRIPAGLRAFLVTLAVVDDIGATIVIALVYHDGFNLAPALIGLGIVILLLLINRVGVQSLIPYLLLGIILWVSFIESGIHTSVAGVILALTIPMNIRHKEQVSPLEKLEHALLPWVNYLILPVFALANAGFVLQKLSISDIFLNPVVSGIFLGLLVGKPIGIITACMLAARLHIAHLPQGVRWKDLIGAGFLGGIGFTTSIFLASLAFKGDTLFEYSKLGILPASLSAAILGWFFLRAVSPKEKELYST